MKSSLTILTCTEIIANNLCEPFFIGHYKSGNYYEKKCTINENLMYKTSTAGGKCT